MSIIASLPLDISRHHVYILILAGGWMIFNLSLPGAPGTTDVKGHILSLCCFPGVRSGFHLLPKLWAMHLVVATESGP